MSPCWDHRGQHRDLPRGYLAPWQNATFLVVGGYWHSYGTGSNYFDIVPQISWSPQTVWQDFSESMVTSHLKSQKIVPEDRPAGPFPGKDSPSSQISNPFCVCQCQDEILESFVSWDLACKSLCINSICRWSEPAGCLTWLHGDTFGHKGAPRVFLQFTGVLGNRWDLRSRGLLLHISMMFCLFNEVYRIQSCWWNLLSNDISWHTHRIHDVYYMVDFIITIIYHYLPTVIYHRN